MPNVGRLFALVAAGLFFTSSSLWAGSIRMLPPDQSNASETTCLKGEGNKILSWDGENPIKCNVGVTVDVTGRVGIGTQTPTSTLSMNNAGGAAILDINAPLANQSSIYFKNLTNGLDWALYRVDGTRNLSFWNPTGGQAITLLQANNNVGIGVPDPVSKLDVAGSVKVANDATPCSATRAGTIRWNGVSFQGCNGTDWVTFGTKVSIDYQTCRDGVEKDGKELNHYYNKWLATMGGGNINIACTERDYVVVATDHNNVNSLYCCKLKIE